jgi:hypothetical protein
MVTIVIPAAAGFGMSGIRHAGGMGHLRPLMEPGCLRVSRIAGGTGIQAGIASLHGVGSGEIRAARHS